MRCVTSLGSILAILSAFTTNSTRPVDKKLDVSCFAFYAARLAPPAQVLISFSNLSKAPYRQWPAAQSDNHVDGGWSKLFGNDYQAQSISSKSSPHFDWELGIRFRSAGVREAKWYDAFE
jgi:hypothetical protein